MTSPTQPPPEQPPPTRRHARRAAVDAAGTLEADLRARLSALSPEAKVRLLADDTPRRLPAAPEVGLRAVVLSEGPAGVRGASEDPRETSASFPAPSALAATWDLALAARTGRMLALEARRHGVDVVLAPVANLQRTPVAGPHADCFSEDPLLTARLASEVVASLQADGVGACVERFVAADSAAGSGCVAQISERALREVYLAPFETAVRDAGAWCVMVGPGGVDDGVEAAPMSEHRRLLRDVLQGEWGFDGVVVGERLPVALGEDAALSDDEVDRSVLRLLRLAARVGALAGAGGEPDAAATGGASATAARLAGRPPVTGRRADHGTRAGRAFLREVAARSTVVLRDGPRRLPLDASRVLSVALIGPNAVDPFLHPGGGGVRPDHVVSPAEGLRAALPGAHVAVHRGVPVRRTPPEIDAEQEARDPRSGRRGVRVDLLDAAGSVLESWVEGASRAGGAEWTGWVRTANPAAAAVRVSADVVLFEPGEHWVGVGALGWCEVGVDGRAAVVSDAGSAPQPGSRPAPVPGPGLDAPEALAGRAVFVLEPRTVRVEATMQALDAGGAERIARAAIRHRRPEPAPEQEVADAVAAARTADLVVLLVGTNDEVESVDRDRTSLALPGRQDELVERVLAARPDAVVVVNAGAPVLLPWLSRAQTVLWAWPGGQEFGHALADVLLGRAEPAGRLPWTLPASLADVPVPMAIPGPDGVLPYAEGIHVGYRAWEASGRVPAAPFGHGLGWTDWAYTGIGTQEADDGALAVAVRVRNTGPRAGHEVVQAYLDVADGGASAPERPARWLAGFAVVEAEPGAEVTTTILVPRRAFEVWAPASSSWVVPPGRYRVRVGRSVRDLRLDVEVRR